MNNPYVSFQSPEDVQRYQMLQQNAQAMQQQSMHPQMAPGGQESWTQGIAQVAQALASKRLKQRADNMVWNAQRPDVANAGAVQMPAIQPVAPIIPYGGSS
jgi:hypothetical protein